MQQSEHPVAVLAALREEAKALARHLGRARIEGPGLQSWAGRLAGKPVVLIVTGVGKVAAAIAAQFACDVYHPRALVSIGLAGATQSDDAHGRLIVASGAVQHDMDARPLTDAQGVVAGLGLSVFPADTTLSDMFRRAAESTIGQSGRVSSGLVLTGDQIVTSRAARDLITAAFPDGACLDMETAAIAQVAHQNGMSWGGLRVTSDSADESFELEKVISFGAGTAGELLAKVVIRALEDL